MTLAALQHLIRSAKALAEDREILILGSASLLATFPELGLPDAPLAATFDADICPQPYDEITAVMLDEALGKTGPTTCVTDITPISCATPFLKPCRAGGVTA